MRPIFALYTGPAADRTFMEPAMKREAERFDADYRRIEPEDIVDGALDNPAIVHLSLPGASSSQIYQDSFGDKGKAAISRAVHDGLAIDGTCAGSYPFGVAIQYRKEIPGYERRPETTMGFINATVCGELPLLKPHNGELLQGWDRAALAPVSFGQSRAKLFYWGGGMLLPHGKNPDLRVLSRYSSLPTQPVAMAAQPVGRGIVVFNGIHPEVTGEALLRTPGIESLDQGDGGRWRLALAEELVRQEPQRQALWDMKIMWGLVAARSQKFRLRDRLPSRQSAPARA